MGSTIDGVDVIGKAEHGLGVAVVVMQADLYMYRVLVGFHVNRLIVQRLLAPIEVLDELRYAAVVLKLCRLRFAGFRVGRALVGERDEQALVEEGQFAETLGQRVKVVFGRGENCLVGNEVNLGAALLAGPGFLQFAGGLAFGVRLLPGEAVAPDFEIEVFAERVHAGHTHTVQSTGNFVSRRIKFAAGVQLGHDDLSGGNLLTVDVHGVNGNTTAVVNHRDRIVDVDGDFDLVGESGERLVNGVIDDFVDEMVQTHFAGRSDVHCRTFADGFHTAEDLDGVGGVISVTIRCRSLAVFYFCF